MNKNMALTIVAVVLLGMALVVYNEYTTTPPAPPIPNAQNQENTSSTELTPPAEPAATETDTQSKQDQKQNVEQESGMPEQSAITPPSSDIKQWESNAPLAPVVPSPIAKDTTQEAPPAQAPELPSNSEQSSMPSAVPNIDEKQDPTDKQVAEKTISAPIKEEQEKPKTIEPKQEVVKKTTPKPSEATKSGAKEIKKITVSTVGDGVTVRIDSLQTLGYKAMRLNSPERIVLDLNGTWKVKAPGVPKNEFVSNVRIGVQKNGTRIVIDLKKAPSSIRYLKYGEVGLDVRIR